MTNNKTNGNLLNDLELDLDKGWGQLEEENSAKIEKAERKKISDYIKNNPKRLDISYKRFYETLYRIFYERDGDANHAMYDLREMLGRIFSDHRSDPVPKGFEEIWSMFCNPRKYKCMADIRCDSCSNSYDIISKFHSYVPQPEARRYGYESQRYIKTESILCPKCARPLFNLHGYELIGIFKHKNENNINDMEVDRMMYERKLQGRWEMESVAESYGLYSND